MALSKTDGRPWTNSFFPQVEGLWELNETWDKTYTKNLKRVMVRDRMGGKTAVNFNVMKLKKEDENFVINQL